LKVRAYYVYILASGIGGTLYIGVTNNLVRRVYEHREKLVKGFIKKYGVTRLVYYEQFGEIGLAIQREHRLKKCIMPGRSNLSKNGIQIGSISILQSHAPEVTGYPRTRV
jgi:putative endonuclease